MIYHVAVFLAMILGGTAAWFFLNSIAQYVVNWHITAYPQWSGDPQVVLMIQLLNWGLLLFCYLPALIYLITNTQRPEAGQ